MEVNSISREVQDTQKMIFELLTQINLQKNHPDPGSKFWKWRKLK